MQRLRYYETLYLTRPDLTEEELTKVQSRLSETISKHDGEIIRSEKWKERDLAYRIGDHKNGVYYLLIYKSLPNAVNEMEKNLRFFNTDVLRFITLKIDEDGAVREGDPSKRNSYNGGI
ncbi:MAG: 30S ribosomal protein S6 [Deltaproteobacteria bacterium]|nr:30S ribosomal protein S6 [Deltaproteobacteria bacterium]